MMVPTIIAKKSHKVGAEDVKSSDACRNRTNPEHPGSLSVRCRKDSVFTEEARKSRESRNRQTRNAERDERNRHILSEATHAPKILLATQAVNHASRSKEEQSLEKRV